MDRFVLGSLLCLQMRRCVWVRRADVHFGVDDACPETEVPLRAGDDLDVVLLRGGGVVAVLVLREAAGDAANVTPRCGAG